MFSTSAFSSVRRRLLRATAVLVVAAAGAACTTGGSDGSNQPPTTDAATTTVLSVEAPEAVHRLVSGINAGDVDGFSTTFAPRGLFLPRGLFQGSDWYGFWDPARLYIEERPLVEAWFAINAAWDTEVELRSCTEQSLSPDDVAEGIDERVDCAVATRWHALSTEITEGWSVALREGKIVFWGASADWSNLDLLDLDPSSRNLPLGYSGLLDWEDWLKANHPDDASAWLNPRAVEQSIFDAIGDRGLATRVAPLLSYATKSWEIEGHGFTPLGLIPYDPAFGDEIEASIRQYLTQP